VGRWTEAEAAYRSAVYLEEKWSAKFPDLRTNLGGYYGNVGRLHFYQGRWSDAEAAVQRAISEYEKRAAESGGSLCGCYSYFGHIIRDQGKAEASLAWYDKALRTGESVLAREPRVVRGNLRDAHQGRAEALTRLSRHAEAVKDWDRAIELDDGPRRPRFRLRRAECLARTGDTTGAAADAAKAIAEADALAADANAKPDALFECAGAFALASAAGSDDAMKAEAHAARAVGLLRRAAVGGFPNTHRMMKDAEFAPLRGRAAFADLLWNLADGPPQP
jgi:tetratricopeptide (TPR) repeat protein